MENNEKRKNSTGLIIIIIVLLLIIGGLTYYSFFYKENSSTTKQTEVEKESDKTETNKEIELDINNANVKQLYKYVHPAFYYGIDSTVFKYEKKTTEEMTDFEKSSLAANLYSQYVYNIYEGTEGEIAISEENVKNAYEVVFGTGSYKQLDEISYSCSRLKYDATNKRYYEMKGACGGTAPGFTYEKIIKATKYSDRIEITTGYVFFSGMDNNIYRNIETTETLGTYTSNTSDSDFANECEIFISNNKDKVKQNTYTFKIDDKGFYYYIGFETTQK